MRGGLDRHTRLARPWTADGLIREGSRRFRAARLDYGHGTTGPRDEAAYLTLHALGLPHDADAATLALPVAASRASRVLALFARRIRSRKPAAYLTREAWLGDFRFYVDDRVIVPRSHVAGLLLEGTIAPWLGRVGSALDLCTGSGCLAILLAHAFPRARVDAVDLSPGAIAVARRNVSDYRLRRRLRVMKSDLFSALGGQRYDLIVSNPPYVTAAAMRRLPPEYRREPRMALAGGKDGLDLVRKILQESARHLSARGVLVVEVGSGRARVERAFPRTAFTWLENPGGGDVFLLRREDLPAGREVFPWSRRAFPA